MLCNVTAEQRRNVLSSALRSYLAAWRKAATVTGMLEDARDEQ